MNASRRNILLIVAALLLMGTAVVGATRLIAATHMSGTEGVAHSIVASCASTGADHEPCYESEVPNLYPDMSVAQIFDVVREIRSLDPSYQFCHVLAHKIGNRVVSEDPNNWLDAIPLNPSDVCSNGFIHGVFEGRFGADVLDDATIQEFMPQFKEACEPHSGWAPSNLDQAICYHGMGHVFDFITNADIPNALKLCAEVTPERYARICPQGVFMQIFQPMEPDDYELIAQMPVKPTKATIRTFCAAFKDPMYVGTCLSKSWPLFESPTFDGTEVASFCSGQPNATETEQCYVVVSSVVGRVALKDPERAASICENFPIERRETCYEYSAETVLEEDLNDSNAAISFCERSGSFTSEQCMRDLVDHSNFIFGEDTSAYTRFCDSLPDTQRPRCFDNLHRGTPQ